MDSRQGGDRGRTERRRGGLRPLAASLPKAAGKSFGRRGLGEGGLVADWSSIVGSELAAACLPSRLSFPQGRERKQGTLTLRVEPGHGPTVQHLQPLIIERVNGYLGYGAVARLSLHQSPLGLARPARKAPPAPLPPDLAAALDSETGQIQDDELRDALRRLGRAVLQAPGKPKGS